MNVLEYIVELKGRISKLESERDKWRAVATRAANERDAAVAGYEAEARHLKAECQRFHDYWQSALRYARYAYLPHDALRCAQNYAEKARSVTFEDGHEPAKESPVAQCEPGRKEKNNDH